MCINWPPASSKITKLNRILVLLVQSWDRVTLSASPRLKWTCGIDWLPPAPAQPPLLQLRGQGGGGVDGYTEMGINYSILCLGDAEKSTRVELILCCFFCWWTFYRSTHRNSTSRVGAMWHNCTKCTCAVVLVHFRQFKSTRQNKMYDVICISHILIRFSFLLAYI